MEMLGNYVWVWIVTWLKCDAEVVHRKVKSFISVDYTNQIC